MRNIVKYPVILFINDYKVQKNQLNWVIRTGIKMAPIANMINIMMQHIFLIRMRYFSRGLILILSIF